MEDLLLWRDVRKSAIVFVGITLLYILLEWSHLSLLRIVSHTLLAIVTVSFLWNNIATPMKLYAPDLIRNKLRAPALD